MKHHYSSFLLLSCLVISNVQCTSVLDAEGKLSTSSLVTVTNYRTVMQDEEVKKNPFLKGSAEVRKATEELLKKQGAVAEAEFNALEKQAELMLTEERQNQLVKNGLLFEALCRTGDFPAMLEVFNNMPAEELGRALKDGLQAYGQLSFAIVKLLSTKTHVPEKLKPFEAEVDAKVKEQYEKRKKDREGMKMLRETGIIK
ncbi:MAG TPA: hypothetical protein VGT41_02015 [Candidatus Babeliales bacterium]|nr:hypothetical protein [Candidatus Babeliales bacterium]